MKLHGALSGILKNSDFQKAMRNAGQEVAGQETPEHFGEFMKFEAAKWAKTVQLSGATVN